MRLYSGQVRVIAREILDDLVKAAAVEIDEGREEDARLDIEAVLKEYIRVDRELSEQARDLVRERGMGNSAFAKTKRQLAKQIEFKVGEDAMTWIIDQCIEMLIYTDNIAEVFSDDLALRVIVRTVLRRYDDTETELDREVRGKLKHLEEGSTSWDVEYQRAMDNIKRTKGLNG